MTTACITRQHTRWRDKNDELRTLAPKMTNFVLLRQKCRISYSCAKNDEFRTLALPVNNNITVLISFQTNFSQFLGATAVANFSCCKENVDTLS